MLGVPSRAFVASPGLIDFGDAAKALGARKLLYDALNNGDIAAKL